MCGTCEIQCSTVNKDRRLGDTPQFRKALLQAHLALESHGLATRARLASIENVITGLKKLQRVFSWRFLRKQACFLTAHIRRQTQSHNPTAYFARAVKIWGKGEEGFDVLAYH